MSQRIKEDIYDSQISPLMLQIIKICQQNKLAMIASFELDACDERGPLLCTSHTHNEAGANEIFAQAAYMIKNGGQVNPYTLMISTDGEQT